MKKKVYSKKVRSRRVPSLLESAVALLLVCSVIVIGLQQGIGSQMSLFLGACIAIGEALFFGVPWDEIQEAFLKVLSDSLIPIIILMIVGIMVGAWLAGGTVPAIMYYGLKLCSPAIILPLTFILCSVMSVFTGTSFGSIATMGLAFTGVAMGMGIPAPMVVGAVVSGAYFGDKLSPMSDSTNIASAMTGADLYEHIGSMMYSTVPATILCVVIYALLGMKYSAMAMDNSTILAMTGALEDGFNLSPVVIIPAVMMLVVSVLKVPAILGLSVCALISVVFAMVSQGLGFVEVMSACFAGYTSETGMELVDTILSRGGLTSMMETVALVIMAGIMGGALNSSGIIQVLVDEALMKMVKSEKSLVAATMVYSYFILLISGSQPLGVVMGGTAFKGVYKKMDVHKKVLSRALADTSTLAAPLVPWSVAAAYITGVLGVNMGYVKYSFLCWIVPVFTVLCALSGIGMWRDDGTAFNRRKKIAADE